MKLNTRYLLIICLSVVVFGGWDYLSRSFLLIFGMDYSFMLGLGLFLLWVISIVIIMVITKEDSK